VLASAGATPVRSVTREVASRPVTIAHAVPHGIRNDSNIFKLLTEVLR
jgi:hypothetical protein